MKNKTILALTSLPVLFAGYVLFHPGIAYAQTPLARALPASDFKEVGAYEIDPAHTFIGFDIGHLGISRVQGRFTKLAGSLKVDLSDLRNSSVEVTVQVSSVDTAVAARDADLRSKEYFDVGKFPLMTFKSTEVVKEGDGYTAVGKLTLKGVPKPVRIHFKQYGPIRDMAGKSRIGVVADPIVIHRQDFGMDYDELQVSDDVNVRISLEATLTHAK